MVTGLIVVNFTHPLESADIDDIADACGGEVTAVVDQSTHFDDTASFADQAKRLVDAVGLPAEAWQSGRVVVNLPALAPIAGCVLAELHGRGGAFPPVVRVARRPHTGIFEVAEVISLQDIRDGARARRAGSRDHGGQE